MIKTILSVLTGRQSLLVKNFVTSTSVYSGYKRYDSENDSIRQGTPSIEELTPKDSLALSFDKYGLSSLVTLETHSQLFDGIKYTDLPIIHIKSSSNNTIILASDASGAALAIQSGGRVGFRNAKKGTNVAAQAAALALAGVSQWFTF
uniref:Uncharacterized protein n=1 Tax=Arion vulgaris TaxID=1028688 RepID=A0A0B7AZK2_9EUPU